MAGIIALITKILSILPLLVSSLISLVQVVIKGVKETVTAIINLLFPFFPDGGKFEKFVLAVRDKINAFDLWFEKIKDVILKFVGVTS